MNGRTNGQKSGQTKTRKAIVWLIPRNTYKLKAWNLISRHSQDKKRDSFFSQLTQIFKKYCQSLRRSTKYHRKKKCHSAWLCLFFNDETNTKNETKNTAENHRGFLGTTKRQTTVI